jgi:hypothetical protein
MDSLGNAFFAVQQRNTRYQESRDKNLKDVHHD